MMKKLMTYIIPILFTLFISGCNNLDLLSEADQPNHQANLSQDDPSVTIDAQQFENGTSHAFSLDSAWITQDLIHLKVSFSGCEAEVPGALITDGYFMESFPVQLNLKFNLSEAGGDCDMAVLQTYTFDLSPLKAAYSRAYQVSQATILLNIADRQLSYRF
ncbi:MAG: hypothetical protein ACNS62_07045 [Candidatus Cyclobacteriaceae bacterium M3_2C_046]